MLAKVLDRGPDMRTFPSRVEAGRQLAAALASYAHRTDVLVLALPRGGVPIAAEIARALRVPFDLLLVRKLGVPGHEELAMGAIAEGGVTVLSDELIRELAIPDRAIEAAAARERAELERRARLFRGDRPAPDVAGRTVILIDDGLATGATMESAVRAMRERHAARIVVAVPVGARDTCARLSRMADELAVLQTPEPFIAVGVWYDAFPQLTDDEVVGLLKRT
jgi:predicted phosphoribosyltransferase